MYISEDELTPIYSDELANRRFRALLLRTAVAGLLLLAVATGAALVASHRLIERRAWDDELVFAALASEMSPGRAAALIEVSHRRGVLVEPTGATVLAGFSRATSERTRRAWLDQIGPAARNRDDRHFITTDGDGTRWWHSAVEADDGILVVSRRASTAMDPWREQALVILAVGCLLACAVVGATVLADRRVGRPVRLLGEAGAQLRVRGRIGSDLRRRLRHIAETPVELRQLVDDLDELEADMQRGDRRVTALLNAGASLGGSLDEATVLARALEHLEHLLGVERAAIIRYDPRIETFEVVASRGHDEAYLGDLASRADDPTLPSLRSLREQSPVQVPDVEAEVVSASLRERGRRHGYRSVLAIPLAAALERPMVLLLHTTGPRTYSFDEVELSRSFAAIAGAALRNAELFASTDARLRVQTSRLEAIVGSVDEGILVESDEGRVLFANPIMRSLLPPGVVAEDVADTTRFLDAVVRRSPAPAAARADLDRLDIDSSPCDITLEVDEVIGSADGSATYRVRPFAVRDARGLQIGRGQTWRDVSRERELERMKSGLLATVSHEFRSPLALIKGYATTLLAEDVTWGDADRREFLRLVSSEADRLTELVKRILDMRRIDAGMVQLQRLPLDVATLVDRAVLALPTEQARITVHPVDPRIAVEVDPARMVTVLRNLLENACKYSPADRPVEVAVTVDARPAGRGRRSGAGGSTTVRIAIRDHGAGIPARLRDPIFDTFVRGEPGLDASGGGLGLGLAIAKGFTEAHGGNIGVAEPSDGTPGSVFVVILPEADRSALEVVR